MYNIVYSWGILIKVVSSLDQYTCICSLGVLIKEMSSLRNVKISCNDNGVER